MMRSHGLTLAAAGAILGPMHFIGGTGALLLTTWLMSLRAFNKPRSILLLIGAVTALATIPSCWFTSLKAAREWSCRCGC
jgi:hypothetical protein